MLRKSIIAVILLLVILGLSWIKTVRDHQPKSTDAMETVVPVRDTSIDPGEVPPGEMVEPDSATTAAATPEVKSTTPKNKPDTLSDAFKQTLHDYCQAVYEKLPADLTDAERLAAAGNIAKETANRFAVKEKVVLALWNPEGGELASMDRQRTASTSSTPDEQQALADQVTQYFKDRTAHLPKDLTDVEKKIALDEIRKESADKFSLSLDQVYSIWQERQLTTVSADALDAVGMDHQAPKVDDQYRRRIARYYRERFDSLPSNLTEYQRTVAVAELKYQTAAHFSISLSEFEKIWQEYEHSES